MHGAMLARWMLTGYTFIIFILSGFLDSKSLRVSRRTGVGCRWLVCSQGMGLAKGNNDSSTRHSCSAVWLDVSATGRCRPLCPSYPNMSLPCPGLKQGHQSPAAEDGGHGCHTKLWSPGHIRQHSGRSSQLWGHILHLLSKQSLFLNGDFGLNFAFKFISFHFINFTVSCKSSSEDFLLISSKLESHLLLLVVECEMLRKMIQAWECWESGTLNLTWFKMI